MKRSDVERLLGPPTSVNASTVAAGAAGNLRATRLMRSWAQMTDPGSPTPARTIEVFIIRGRVAQVRVLSPKQS